jgi:hypothetical protein
LDIAPRIATVPTTDLPNHAVQAEESHAKSAKDAKDANHPIGKSTHQTVNERFVDELPF